MQVRGFGGATRWRLVAALALLALPAVGLTSRPPAADAAGTSFHFVVDDVGDTGDIDPGDGTCAAGAAGPTTTCTLRAAVEELNAQHALANTGPHTVTFADNTNTAADGPIEVATPLTVETSVTFTGNGSTFPQTAIRGSGTGRVLDLVTASTVVTLDGLRIERGDTGGTLDGAMVRSTGVDLTLSASGLNAFGTIGADGGLVAQIGGRLTIDQGTFLVQSRATRGGAVFLGGGAELVAEDAEFDQNRANSGSGGSIFAEAGTQVTITGSEFTSGSAGSGGSIASAGTTSITSTTFTDVSVTGDGGCIHQSGGSLTITGNDPAAGDTLFEICAADAAGGGVFVDGGAAFTVSGAQFTDNAAGGSGGGIHIADSAAGTSSITNSLFTDNCARASGSCFVAVAANANGGAILAGDDLVIDGSTFEGNQSFGDGGAIATDGTAAVSIQKSVFSNNQALTGDTAGSGGALNIAGGTQVTIGLSAFVNSVGANHANDNGGGIFNGGTLNLTNATVSGSTALSNGGAIFGTGGSTTTLTNVTIVGNDADTGGGISGAGTFDLRNSIVSGNTAVSATPDCSLLAGGVSNGGNIAGTNSCDGFLTASSDQTGTDPQLGALTGSGSGQAHVPQVGSPAVDSGVNTGCPATDQRSDPRPIDSDLDGTPGCDSGAIEVVHGPTITSIAPDELPEGTTAATITIVGSNYAGKNMTADFGDGITINSVSHDSQGQITVDVSVDTVSTDQVAAGAGTGGGSAAGLLGRPAVLAQIVSVNDVTVTRSDGQTATCTGCFTVTPAAATTPPPPAPAPEPPPTITPAPLPPATPVTPAAPAPLPPATPVAPAPAGDFEFDLEFDLLPPAEPIEPAPQEEEPPEPSIPGPGEELERSQFTQSLIRPSQVDLSLGALGTSALLVALLILLIGFPAELFNKTWEENDTRIRAALDRWLPGRHPGGPGTLKATPRSGQAARAMTFITFTGLMALVYGFIEPDFDPISEEGLVLVVGLLTALIVVTLVYEFTEILDARRRYGAHGPMRVYPATMMFGIITVAASRMLAFTPGYMYGFVAGADVKVDDEDGGPPLALAAAVLIFATVLAWIAWIPIDRTLEQGNLSLPLLIVDAVLVGIVVAGVEGIAFGFAPLRFLDGARVRTWNAWLWFALYFTGIFALVHVLMHPENGLAETASDADIIAMFVLFIGFGLFSVSFWAYFRYTGGNEDAGLDQRPADPPTPAVNAW